jgi:hypothetical protein
MHASLILSIRQALESQTKQPSVGDHFLSIPHKYQFMAKTGDTGFPNPAPPPVGAMAHAQQWRDEDLGVKAIGHPFPETRRKATQRSHRSSFC